jgi:hypothetical protein
MFNEKQVLNGTSGTVWVNGEELGEIKAIEIKVTGDFEDIKMAGEYGTYNVYKGYKVEGSIKLFKTRNVAANLVAEGYRTGVMPSIKVITKLTDKTTGKSERWCIENVNITEFGHKWEVGSVGEDEIPFKAGKYTVLESI